MWPFFLTKPMSFTQTIDANPEAVIAVLHGSTSLGEAPALITVTLDALHPSQFTITEALPILGCFKANATFHVTFNMQADGLITDVVASARTKQTAHFSVKTGQDNKTEVIEKATVTVSY
jgi:hypothetical protein